MHQMSAPESPSVTDTSPTALHATLIGWFADTARDLPWRRAAARADGLSLIHI